MHFKTVKQLLMLLPTTLMDLSEKIPRPIFNDDVLLKLSKNIGKEIHDWCKDGMTLQCCISDCKKILKTHSNKGGYDIAKEFEYAGYSADSQLVEILDMVTYERDNLVDAEVAKWVIKYSIEPSLPVGSFITFKNGFKQSTGEITGYKKKIAAYLVCSELEGMPKNGSTRVVLSYEKAELIQPFVVNIGN